MLSKDLPQKPGPAHQAADLNNAQKAAQGAPRGPLLIVAGAGTGKTRTLIARLAHFIETGVLPERICAITFTNKAASEMRERIRDANDANSMRIPRMGSSNNSQHSDVFVDSHRVAGPFIGTFHALGASILRREARAFGRKPNFAIFDDHDSFSLVKKASKKLMTHDQRLTTPNRSATGQANDKKSMSEVVSRKSSVVSPAFFAGKISEIKNKFGILEQLKGSSRQEDILAIKVFETYERAMLENNAFDFDDLITKPVELFRGRAETLKKYQGRFDAILVDEYQDVSPMQNELIKLLAGAHKNVSVVGDDEQLIYGWRYADLKIFLGFERNWPGARIAFLEENYRSTGNIINAAAAVVANNQYRHPKTLWTKNPAGAQIHITETMDEVEEAERIAQHIYNPKNPNLIRTPRISNLEHSDVFVDSDRDTSTAVLYRTNAQSRAVEQALIRRQIPYRIFGGTKFYERMEVRDIVAGLRYFSNNADAVSRKRLEKNLTKTAFRELHAAFAQAPKTARPPELIERFLAATNYLDRLERTFANADDRKENIVELLAFAGRFEDLQTFLENVALVQATDMPSKSTHDKRLMTNDQHSSLVIGHESLVHLSTIHLAKGLEFDRVFIAGCAEGLLPHARSLENEEQLEEERRLMYVAMTRAKKELAISFYDVPSRFLSEIPQELMTLMSPAKNDGLNTDTEEEFIDVDG